MKTPMREREKLPSLIESTGLLRSFHGSQNRIEVADTSEDNSKSLQTRVEKLAVSVIMHVFARAAGRLGKGPDHGIGA